MSHFARVSFQFGVVALVLVVLPFTAEGVGITATVKIGLCGDGIIDSAEDCDGVELGSASCVTEGFSSGSLTCYPTCEFNTSACVAAVKSIPASNSSGSSRSSSQKSAAAQPSQTDTFTTFLATVTNALKNFVAPPPAPATPPASSQAAIAAQPRNVAASGAAKGDGSATPSRIIPQVAPQATPPTTFNKEPPRQAQRITPTMLQHITTQLWNVTSRFQALMERIRHIQFRPSAGLRGMFSIAEEGQLAASGATQGEVRATITPIPDEKMSIPIGRMMLSFMRGVIFAWLW